MAVSGRRNVGGPPYICLHLQSSCDDLRAGDHLVCGLINTYFGDTLGALQHLYLPCIACWLVFPLWKYVLCFRALKNTNQSDFGDSRLVLFWWGFVKPETFLVCVSFSRKMSSHDLGKAWGSGPWIWWIWMGLVSDFWNMSIYIDDVRCLHMILDTPATFEVPCSAHNACFAILKAYFHSTKAKIAWARDWNKLTTHEHAAWNVVQLTGAGQSWRALVC